MKKRTKNTEKRALRRLHDIFGIPYTMDPRRAGSTIVGVMVALVFIGIVTTTMLKSTTSQSTASRGYSSTLIADGMIKSGTVATISYLELDRDSASADTLLNKLDCARNSAQHIFGDQTKMLKMADRQFFGSQLSGLERYDIDDATHDFRGRFEMTGGTRESGGGVKKASLFLKLNLKENVPTEEDEYAIYMSGSMSDGNNGMRIKKGNARFEKNIRFQNNDNEFPGNVYFGGTVDIPGTAVSTFKGKVYAQGKSVMQGKAVFEEDAYFNDALELSKTGSTFRKKTYIQKTFTAQNLSATADTIFRGDVSVGAFAGASTINTTKNVYNRGTGTNAANMGNSAIRNVGAAANKYFHTGTAPLTAGQNGAANFAGGFFKIGDTPDNPDILPGLPNELRCTPIAPQYDISKISSDIVRIDMRTRIYDQNNGATLINRLNSIYDSVKAIPPMGSKLYNDHLVVTVNPQSGGSMLLPGMGSLTFNKKVIFLVESGTLQISSGGFYHSGPASSTMIHIGPGNVGLHGFGSTGLFRGVIYIHANNTHINNEFNNWGPNGKIQGAIRSFSAQRFMWNASTSGSIEIEHSSAVLNQFKGLELPAPAQPGCPSSPVTPPTQGGCVADNGSKLMIDPIPGWGDYRLSAVPLGIYFR